MKLSANHNNARPAAHPAARPASRPAFISQLLVWSLVLVGIMGGSGVAVVWQRQLIAQTSNRIKILENSLAEVERHQTEINTEIASEQSLDSLLRRNAGFALGLAPISEQQLVRVGASPARALADRRRAETRATTTPPRAGRAP